MDQLQGALKNWIFPLSGRQSRGEVVLGDSGKGPCHLPNLQNCSEENSRRPEEAHDQLPAGESMGKQLPPGQFHLTLRQENCASKAGGRLSLQLSFTPS